MLFKNSNFNLLMPEKLASEIIINTVRSINKSDPAIQLEHTK